MQAREALRQIAWQRYLKGDSLQARAVWPALILVATFLTYAATLGFGFVFDDQAGIVSNDSIRSWRYLPNYFTSHVWSFIYPHLLSNYYRPLFLVWLRLNDAIFGLHPWGWHLTSVLAHVAVTYLVYRLAHRLTQDARVAAAAGLFFGLHPVHIEAVAYVSAAPEPLSALFILAALLAWLRSREDRSAGWWLAASLFFFSLALLSKESGMMLPILIGIYAWIRPRGEDKPTTPWIRSRAALAGAAPFLAVMLAYVPLRLWALKGFAHTITPVALRTEILTIPSVLVFYLRLLLMPTRLSCYYDMAYIPAATVQGFLLPLAGVLAALAILTVWYVLTRRAWPEEASSLAFAGLWTMVAVLPVLNFRLVPEGEIAHDRYMYLPSAGFSILIGLAVAQGLRALERTRLWPGAVVVAAGLAGLVMGGTTLQQSLYWSDDLSLNSRAHEIAPHNVSATTSLAAAVAERGMDGPAMALYEQVLAVKPEFWRANVNLAYLLYAHGHYPEAARYFSRACASDPTDGGQFLYLGMALLRMGQPAEAERAVRTALLVRPNGKYYHLGLGMVLAQEGKLPEARQEIETELSADPQNAQAQALLNEIKRKMQGRP